MRSLCAIGLLAFFAALVTLPIPTAADPAPHTLHPAPAPNGMAALINRPAFARFAQASEARDGDDEIVISPLLNWYMHELLSRRDDDQQTHDFTDELLAANLHLAEETHATRGASTFDDQAAHVQSDDLGATTKWYQVLNDDGFGLTFDAQIKTEDAFASALQSYTRNGISAVRFTPARGGRSLYVFYGTHDVITALRQRMSPILWQNLARGFFAGAPTVTDFAIDRNVVLGDRLRNGDGFGAKFDGYCAVGGQTIIERIVIAASATRLDVSLGGSVRDYPINKMIQGSCESLPSRLPRGHAKTTDAYLYAVSDVESGVLLLLGQHG